MSGEQTQSRRVDEYISDDEDVAKVSRGPTRTFAVTDRRVLDIKEGETTEGKPIENLQSTLFTNVAKADLRIEESISTVDSGQRALAAVIGVTGLIILVAGLLLGGGPGVGVAVVGLIGIFLAFYLWVNATETEPGGITIRLRHATADEEVTDRYVLPEDQDATAKTVIRQVGRVHHPQQD